MTVLLLYLGSGLATGNIRFGDSIMGSSPQLADFPALFFIFVTLIFAIKHWTEKYKIRVRRKVQSIAPQWSLLPSSIFPFLWINFPSSLYMFGYIQYIQYIFNPLTHSETHNNVIFCFPPQEIRNVSMGSPAQWRTILLWKITPTGSIRLKETNIYI